MGTIVIEEYGSVGSGANRDAPIANLQTMLATTVDATTSTSAESITLNLGTRVITVFAVEDHRVSVLSSNGSIKYGFVASGFYRDFGVDEGSVLYYRSDV